MMKENNKEKQIKKYGSFRIIGKSEQ